MEAKGCPLGNSGKLDAASLFDGGWIDDFDTTNSPSTDTSVGYPLSHFRPCFSADVDGELWWGGFTAALAVNNETDAKA